MALNQAVTFGPFRLDPAEGTVWRDEEPVALRPKGFGVLCYLVEHRGRLIPKNDLLDAVWGRRFVSEGVLKGVIQSLRQALDDDPKAPRYIETAHRRGYRFIAEVRRALPAVPAAPARHLVGREAALGRLHEWLHQALSGEHPLVLVSGEPGIGKTALIEAFLPQATHAGALCTVGQCVEQYGQGEPYLPFLEALNTLARHAGAPLVEALRRFAPTWLVQLPWLLTEADRSFLQQEVLGATKERMLREMGELLEHWTTEHPLVLVLEDLHWSDPASVDLLAYLARRRAPARWLLIGSYRPADLILAEHALKGVKQELWLHGRCQELALEALSERDIAAYVHLRAGDRPMTPAVVEVLYSRTEGLPLFLVSLVDYWLAPAATLEDLTSETLPTEWPETLQQMIEKRVEQLSDTDRHLLEAASVSGVEFAAAVLAPILNEPVEPIEERCVLLARRHQFLRPAHIGEWPDGTVTASYTFLHALYQQVLYRRIPATQKARWHQSIGERLEAAHGAEADRIAATLAIHFEHGRDAFRAAKYLRQAAENAARRYAHREAIGYLTRALELVGRLPEAERTTVKMRLLGVAGVCHGGGDQ